MKKLWIPLVFLCSMLHAQQHGDLDQTFGTNGIVNFSISDYYDMIYDVAVQSDGKIVTVGRARMDGTNYYMAVTSHNPDGSYDEIFGTNGIKVFQPTYNYGNFAMQVKLLDNGQILAGGYAYDGGNNSDPLIVKLNIDGSLEPSFGENGVSYITSSESITMEALDVQEDGKIILAGYINDVLGAIRYTADGQIDTGFGENGRFIISTPNSIYSFAKDIAILPDGKIIITGIIMNSDGIYDCIVTRLKEDGTIDESFGDNGMTIISAGDGHDFSCAVAIQPDGKIVIGGHMWIANVPTLQYDFLAIRFNENGSLDTEFGQNGFAMARYYEGEANYLSDIAIAPNGNIYGTGYATHDSNNAITIVCFNSEGILDTSFGETGMVGIEIGNNNEAEAVAIQPDGNIIVGGYYFTSNGSNCIVARLVGPEMTYPSIIDIAVTLLDETSAATTATPNEATTEYHYGLMTKEQFEEIGEEAAVETIRNNNNPLYEEDTYTWIDLTPNTTYYAIATGKNADGVWGETTLVEFITTINGIAPANEVDISLSPNPADDCILISGKDIKTLSIYDSNGRTIFKQNVTSGETGISTTSFKNGVYLLKSYDNRTKKFVVSHQ